MDYDMWIELADKITDKVLDMVGNGTINDPLQVFGTIEEILRQFNDERVVRIYLNIPSPEVVEKILEKARKRLLNKLDMGKNKKV